MGQPIFSREEWIRVSENSVWSPFSLLFLFLFHSFGPSVWSRWQQYFRPLEQPVIVFQLPFYLKNMTHKVNARSKKTLDRIQMDCIDFLNTQTYLLLPFLELEITPLQNEQIVVVSPFGFIYTMYSLFYINEMRQSLPFFLKKTSRLHGSSLLSPCYQLFK